MWYVVGGVYICVRSWGCFLVKIFKSKAKVGYSPGLTFQITQHSRDEALLQSLVKVLGCGRYAKRSKGDAGDFLELAPKFF
jgi:hypothetical protein